MKPTAFLRSFLALTGSSLLTISYSHALTYTWDSTNVTGATPPLILDWFTGGPNTLGLWTGPVVPVSDPTTEIRFFADTTTALPNTAPRTQTVNLNNGGSAFQLGTLTLNGLGSATSGASLTMTLQGDALNFSAATGTISFNSVKNVAPASDTVINYNVNNNIQLGTASSASALTLTGNGDSAGTTTYNIGGTITELQAGGGSILKSGTSIVNITGALSITGAVTVNAGQLNLTNNTNTASSLITNGGTLNVTGTTISATTITANTGTLILAGVTNYNPASGSMTVNSGGILQLGNNTATTFGVAGVYSGNISTGTGGTLRLRSTSDQTLSGIISGSGGINKGNGGTLTLSGPNTYTGRTSFQPANTAGFTVNVSSFNSVVGGTASSSLGAPTTVANGTIDVGGVAQAGVILNYTGLLGETTDRVLAVAWNGNSTQTIQASGGGLLNFTSPFTAAGSGGTGSLVLTGAGNGQVNGITGSINTTGLSKTGNGTWTISGPSTFAQATTITGGILNLSHSLALQNSPFSTASSAGTGSLGLRTSVTTLTLGGLTGANALKGRFTTATGGPSNTTTTGGYDGLTNLTLNTVGGSTSVYTGAIVEGATGMSLTKTGAGIQTLNATHTYTGTTSVNGGFLQLNNGSTLAGGLSVSNAHFASNSSFAGVASVTSGGIISPGASSGAIGTLTLTNATASALTLNGSTGIFDLPSTVTTPDRIAVTGGLVVTNTNTVLLRTSVTGTPAGVYTLMTAGSNSGAGSFVLANGSATRGNATVSMSGSNVILTVAAGGLAGTTTYTGTSGNFNVEKWFVTTNWNNGVVPTGTTNVVLPDQTSAFTIPAFNASTPTYSGDLWIGNNVTLQIGSTTGGAAFNNALGTSGSTIIYMGQNSAISSRNSGFNPTLPQIVLLGDASMRFQESTQVSVNPDFANSISGAFTLTLNSGAGNGFSTHTLNAANSFAGLNLAGTSGVVNAAVSGSIGTANLTISGGGTVNLNHATAISDGSNPILINNGTLAYGTTSAASLTLSTRPIELNGTGQATINNNNTLSSSANILTLAGGISSTAAGAKTLTLGGTNVGLNLVSGAITNGSGGGTVGISKTGVGTWEISGSSNTYTGTTGVSEGTLIMSGNNALTGTITVSGALGATLTLSGNNSGMTSNVTLSTGTGTSASSPRLNINSATALGTGTLTFGGGLATDVVRIDNTNASAVIVSTANTINMGRDFTFVGTRDLNLGTGAITLSGMVASTNRIITVTASTLTLAGAIADGVNGLSGITKAGVNGTLVLSGTNTYTHLTTVSAGTLIAGNNAPSGSAGAFGNASSEISLGAASSNNNASILIGGAFTVGRNIRLATANTTDAGTRVLTLGGNTAHNSEFSGNIFLGTASQAGRGVTLTAASGGQVTFSGVIQNPGSMDATTYTVTKAGSGTVVLSNSNSYTGSTSINEGVLEAAVLANGSSNSSIGASANAATSLVFGAPTATLRYTGGSNVTIDRSFTLSSGVGGGATIESSGVGTLSFSGGPVLAYGTTAQTRVLTLGGTNTGNNTFGKVIANNTGATNATSLVKAGAGKWILSQDNSYTGATSVNGGMLEISGAGDVNQTSSINVAAGATFAYNSSTALTVTPTLNGTGTGSGQRAVLGGTGPINVAVTLDNVGDTLSPGNSPGIESFTVGQSWAAFSYDWEVNDFSDTTGLTAGSDFDQIAITGGLTLTGIAANSYYLNILSLTGLVTGDAANFSEINRSWTILTTTTGITDFNAAYWTLDATGFTNGDTGTWSIAESGNNLVLSYAVIPEPRAALLGGIGMLLLLRRRRN